jgi:thioredoxin 1
MEQQTMPAQSFQELIRSSTPVLVDFYADWCGPCKAMNPVIQEVAREFQGRTRVIKVNIDESQSAASAYNVNAVPTFVLFKEGKIVWRQAGMIDKLSLKRTIESFL